MRDNIFMVSTYMENLIFVLICLNVFMKLLCTLSFMLSSWSI